MPERLVSWMESSLLASKGVRRRQDLASFLQNAGLTGSAVEVGVWRGDFSFWFFQEWRGKKLYLVDPWQVVPNYNDIRNDHFDFEDYNYVKSRFCPHLMSGSVKLCRALSSDAVKVVPNDLDFVYIDANHAYEFVLSDLHTWWDKIRPGGILAGHDIFSHIHPGVTQAVIEFCTQKGLVAHLTQGDYNEHHQMISAASYVIIKGDQCPTYAPFLSALTTQTS